MKESIIYREIFEKIIGFENLNIYPSLPCPYCGQKHLNIDMDTFQYQIVNYEDASQIIQKERKKSISSISETYEENKFLGILLGIGEVAEMIMFKPAKFICFFLCASCSKSTSATGTLKIDNEEDINTSSIKVEYFSPPLSIINLSINLPMEIREELIQSFNHFHSDLSSSGAKLRRAIEKMCFNLGYKEKNLHCSISSMTKDYPNEGGFLHSLKLLGNEATHTNLINEHDLLDAFQVMDYVLHLYDRKIELEIANQMSIELQEKFTKKPYLIK